MKRDIFVILFLFLFPYCAILTSKKIYKCNQTLSPNVCSRMDISSDEANQSIITFSFSPCPKEAPLCDLGVCDQDSICTEVPAEPYLFMGESCKYDSECFSAKCENHTCASAKTGGQNCFYDTDCDPGFSCEKDRLMPLTTCKPLLGLGQGNCVSEGIGLKCFQNLTCHQGQCIQIGSIEIGTNTNTPYECKTFFLHEDESGDTFCSEGPKLVEVNTSYPVACKNKCNYSYKYRNVTYNFSTNCSYGLDESGSALCHPGIGNLMDPIKNVIKWANQSKELKCHYTRNMWCPIGNLTNDYYLSYISYMNITQFTDVYNNSPCVQETIHAKYYDALKKYIPPKPELVNNVRYPLILFGSLILIILA